MRISTYKNLIFGKLMLKVNLLKYYRPNKNYFEYKLFQIHIKAKIQELSK